MAGTGNKLLKMEEGMGTAWAGGVKQNDVGTSDKCTIASKVWFLVIRFSTQVISHTFTSNI